MPPIADIQNRLVKMPLPALSKTISDLKGLNGKSLLLKHHSVEKEAGGKRLTLQGALSLLHVQAIVTRGESNQLGQGSRAEDGMPGHALPGFFR